MSQIPNISENNPPSTSSLRGDSLCALIAPWYFLIAIPAGFIGIGYLGVHLLLQKEGASDVTAQYAAMRQLHAMLQTHGYFGAFVSGVAFHMATKLKGGDQKFSLLSSLMPLLFAVSLTVAYACPASSLGSTLLCAHFALLTTILGASAYRASNAQFLYQILPIQIALISLAVGSVLDLLISFNTLIILWLGVTPALIVSSHQANSESAVIDSGATKLGYWAAYAWLLISILVLLDRTVALDYSLHILATGFLFPIAMLVSSKIICSLTRRTVVKPLLLYIYVLGWQIVPLGRGMRPYLPDSMLAPWIISFSATLIFLFWSLQLGAHAITVLRTKTTPQTGT